MQKKIVFFGGGNMAEGVIRGLVNNQVVNGYDITVSEIFDQRCDYLVKTYGVYATTKDISEATKYADMIVIAVVPSVVSTIATQISAMVGTDTVVLSIAAGVSIQSIENDLGTDKKIVRIMPNTLNQSGSGYSGVCMNKKCSPEDKEFVDTVVGALGQVMHINENMFNTFTAFCNVGPLWFYKTVQSLIDSGVYIGFSRKDARNIVLKNMIGVAKVLEMTGEHPAQKVDQMTSPGGITIEALKVLCDEGFSSALMNSVSACYNKVNEVE